MSATSLDAPRPEQSFFADPAIDRVLAVTMALAAEVYLLRSRVRTLERAQRAAGVEVLPTLSKDEAEAERADAAAFVAHVLEPALGEQQARGPI
jgi:hypothetical protein